MPWKSKAQRGYMWARHPEIAHEFEDATPKKRLRKLPQHVGKGLSLVELSKAVQEETPPKEHKRLIRGKLRQKHFSEAGAALGLTALGATTPKAARHLVARFPKVAHSKPLKALARLEPKANAVSAAATPLSLGVGALGSINFARQQGLEARVEQRKPVVKEERIEASLSELRKSIVHVSGSKSRKLKGKGGVGNITDFKVKALAEKGHFHGGKRGLEDDASQRALRNARPPILNAERLRSITHREVLPYAASPVRKDRFTQKYGQNISEGAENAYTDLGQRKRRRYSDAAAYGALGGVSVPVAHGFIANTARGGWNDVNRSVRFSRRERLASGALGAASLGVTGALGYGFGQRVMEGRSLQQRRNKIKAKGYERAELGQRGRGRPVTAAKADLVDLSKMVRIMPLKPRMGGLMRLPSGRQVTRRGAIVGTSPIRRSFG